MGTLYYAHVNGCDCCQRADRVFLCKSFTTFRHYPDYEYDENPTTTHPARSWKDLKKWLLKQSKVVVVGDNGAVFTVDQFIAETERPQNVEVRAKAVPRQLKAYLDAGIRADTHHVDEEGFLFTRRWFS